VHGRPTEAPLLGLPLLIHWRIQTPQLGASIPSPSLPYYSIILSLASSLPLEVGPLNTARGSDAALQPGLEAAPAEIEFGAF